MTSRQPLVDTSSSSRGAELNGDSSRRVLVVGINYAPEETGIAPYTTDLSEHLVSRGWRVTVLTGMPHYPQWRLDKAYVRQVGARETRNGVDVRRFRHYVPRRQSAGRRGLYEASFLAHACTATAIERPLCTIGVVPSLSGGVVAAVQARRHRVPFGLIVQDLLSPAAAQSGLPGASAMARPVNALEGALARRAAAISIITPSFTPYLLSIGVEQGRIVHVPNWTHVPEPSGRAPAIRRSFGWGTDMRVVLHAGNMGYKQGLHNVLEAARLAADHDRPFRFVFMGDGSQRRHLECLAQGIRTVEFLDAQPKELFMDVLAAADILVLNERATVRDMSLPGKITSYFLSGTPVVAAVRPDGVTATELTRSGGALLVAPEDPQALLDGIDRVISDKALESRLVQAATHYGRENLDRAMLLARGERFVIAVARGAAAEVELGDPSG